MAAGSIAVGGRQTAPRHMMRHAASAVLLLATPAMLTAQASDCRTTVSPTRLAVQAAATTVVTGLEYGSMARSASWRLAQESDRAAVLADPSSHLHALGSYHIARNLGATACASRTEMRRQALRGAALSLSLGAAKEVADGWYNGFSTTDLAVDALGAGYAVAQAYVPVLRHLTPTFSMAPQALAGDRGLRGTLTNYAQQTAWLSANVHELLPASAARVWPASLRLSAGRRAFGGERRSEYVVGLDLDAEHLPGSHPAWMKIKRVLHDVRLPGPAIVIGPNGTRAMGLYW